MKSYFNETTGKIVKGTCILEDILQNHRKLTNLLSALLKSNLKLNLQANLSDKNTKWVLKR